MRIANDFDVAVLYSVSASEKYWVTFYDLMPDSLFDSYENRGASREDMSFSKAERLADPVTWWGSRNNDDWLTLNQIPEHSSFALMITAVLLLAANNARRRRC